MLVPRICYCCKTLQVNVAANFPGNRGKKKKDYRDISMKLVVFIDYIPRRNNQCQEQDIKQRPLLSKEQKY